MTESGVLEYFPPWYQHGDPDEFGYAVLYGFVALATIWLLEYVCELILFSTADGILLSDAAAHIALNNSNWVDIAQWVWNMDKHSRLCRRAFMALVFRCLLVGIDLGILMQAVPRDIYVYENMVGGTELSFSPSAVRDYTAESKVHFPLCKADLVRYKGFKPTAQGMICLVQVAGKPFNFENNSAVATFHFKSTNGMLEIRSTRLHNQHAIRHIMRLTGGQTGDDADLLLVSDRDILELAPQAALITAELPPVNGWDCKPQRISNVTAVLNCTAAPREDLTFKFHRPVILELYGRVGTVKVNPKGTIYSDLGGKPEDPLETNGLGPRLGIITRPRLCIFPAIILLLSIGVLALAMRALIGSQDFVWKLWLFLSLNAGMTSTNTPLSTNCAEIDVENWIMWRGEIVRRTFNFPQLKIVERPRLYPDVSEITRTTFQNI